MLTRQGRAIANRVEMVAREVREQALGALSAREVDTAFRVLEHICDVLAPEEKVIA